MPTPHFWQALADLLRSIAPLLKEKIAMITQTQIDKVVSTAQGMADAAKTLGSAQSDKDASDLALTAAQGDNLAKGAAVTTAEATVTDAETAFEAAIADLKAAF